MKGSFISIPLLTWKIMFVILTGWVNRTVIQPFKLIQYIHVHPFCILFWIFFFNAVYFNNCYIISRISVIINQWYIINNNLASILQCFVSYTCFKIQRSAHHFMIYRFWLLLQLQTCSLEKDNCIFCPHQNIKPVLPI